MTIEREVSLSVDLWPKELELLAIAMALYVVHDADVNVLECLHLEDKLGIGDRVTRWIDEFYHDTGEDE